MTRILGTEATPSLRHRPRQRTLEGLFDAISFALESPAQTMRVHANLHANEQYDKRTIILKDINAAQAFDDTVCSQIVVTLEDAKKKQYNKAAVRIQYTLGAVDAPLQASSGYSLYRYFHDHQAAYAVQKHPLWLTPLCVESPDVQDMVASSFTPELQHLDGSFEDQFRMIESDDVDFIRRVAGQIAIEGH